MLGVIGKRVGEKLVEAFVDACSADDARGAEERTERKSEALRGVEDEDGIEVFLIERLPKREEVDGKGFLKDEEPIDMGIVFQNFHSDGTGEDTDISMGKGFSDIFDGGSGPKGVA